MNPLLSILVHVLQSCRASTHSPCQPRKKKYIYIYISTIYIFKIRDTGRRCCSTRRGKKKEKKKYLTAPAVSETLPLPSYNKQEKQNQNTAPTSPSIHPAQAALVPATAQKQSRCEPPLAHPSRWPEQQKSPAQEAWIRCMGSLKCLPGSAKVLHAPRQRKGYPQVPLPAPTLGDACVSL